MTTLYPYETLFGDLALKVTGISVDSESPDVQVIDLNGDAIDLFLIERKEWDKIEIWATVDGPPSGIQKFDALSAGLTVTLVAQCGATNVRIATPLERSSTDPARWSGTLALPRSNFAGIADLRAVLSGTLDGRSWRFLKASNAWALRFDEPAVPPIEGSVNVKWVNFRADPPANPILPKYATEAFYVDLAAAIPIVYLNLGFENLQPLLQDGPRTGAAAALHHAVRASIAAKVWAAMFAAALDAVVADLPGPDAEGREQAPVFPGSGWQAQVLRRILAVMYEDRSSEDALNEVVRLWRSDEGANAIHSEIATAVEKHIEAGKLLRRAARLIYGEAA